MKATRVRVPIEDRLHAKLAPGPNGCVEFVGARYRGYGVINTGEHSKTVLVHRLSWSMVNGPIPDGMYICHRCDNPPCCNPDHLFLGTPTENQRDMHSKGRYRINAGPRTHCKHGHEFTPENTYVVAATGVRQCRECNRARSNAYYAKHLAKSTVT